MSVARVKTVKKARKDQGECGGCHTPIIAGDSYRWWTVGFRSRSKHKRCAECKIPPPSARESNEKAACILAAEENLAKELDGARDRDDIVQALTEAGEAIREAGTLYQESADAMEEGFGHETEQSSEQANRAEEAEAWAEEIDSSASVLDEEKEPSESDEDYLDRLREEAESIFADNAIDY